MEKCLYCWNIKDNTFKKSSLLGFRNLECSECKKISLLPLSKGTKNFYYFLCAFFILGFIFSLTNWEVTIPWLLFIIPIVALIKNKKLEEKISDTNN